LQVFFEREAEVVTEQGRSLGLQWGWKKAAGEFVSSRSPIPWLHIAETVAREAERRRFARLGILGTKYLMTGPVYPEVLEKVGISFTIPEENDRERIDRIIFKELVNGLFPEESRRYLNQVIQKAQGAGL